MIRKIIFVLFLIPLAIALIALTVANRGLVPLSLDVFNPANPALTFHAPLFVWMFCTLVIGVIVGGIGSWFAQGKHRKKERAYKKEADKLRFEKENNPATQSSASTSLVMSN
ncbi:MAG: lipopolysaccharide assembly protein LapA domain-containing protein [Pseudomonadota bacterium]